MRILFLHNNFPGQFRTLAPALAADPANEVVFGTQETKFSLAGVRKVGWRTSRDAGKEVHRYLRDFERSVLHGQGAFRMAMQLRATGFVPDLVYGFAGVGPTMYMREAFPEARHLRYFDWFYRARNSNGDFFPTKPLTTDRAALFQTRNASMLLDLATCDHGVVTTEWQLAQFPPEYQAKLSLLHDGIDTDFFCPTESYKRQPLVIGDLDLTGVDELVTYATRGMDQYRGFDIFLRAVSELQKLRPRCHVVVAGDDRIPYGSPPPGGTSWKTHMLAELDLDLSRLHFVGLVPKNDMRTLLRAGHAHVYASAPFIPSWSLFEAMSCGALIVGSNTAPVTELVRDGHNGLLFEFHDTNDLVTTLCRALDNADDLRPMRVEASKLIRERYALRDILPRQLKLVSDVVAGTPSSETEASVADRVPAPLLTAHIPARFGAGHSGLAP